MATARFCIKRKKSFKNYKKKSSKFFVFSLGSFARSLTKINLNILAVTFKYSIVQYWTFKDF